MRDERLVATYGAAGLARLQRSRVGVIGAGGMLGGLASLELGQLGVNLLLCDPGAVEAANLGNQLLPADAVGQPKAAARAAQIRALHPGAAVEVLAARVEDVGLGAFAGVDLLLGGLDGRAARVRVSAISQALGIPWVDCAVDGSGERLLGTVTLYDPRRADGACYGCRRSPADLAAIAREGRGPGCPSWRRSEAPLTPPTLAAPALGAVVSGFGVLWGVRVLLGEAEALSSTQLQIGADGAARVRSVALSRSPRCVLPHARLEPLRRLRAARVGDVLAAAAEDLGAAPARLYFADRVLVPGLVCPKCGDERGPARFREAFRDHELRCDCDPRAERVPSALCDALEGDRARQLASARWADLGLPPRDVVTAAAGDGCEVHYLIEEAA